MVSKRKEKTKDTVKKPSRAQHLIDAGHTFKPGNKLGGRPKGSRNKFAEQFFKDFLADWEVAGAYAIQACRLEDPATYCRIAASLVPKELNLKEGDSALDKLLDQFSDEDLDKFIAGLIAVGAAEQGKGQEVKTLPRK